jgi:hypothetical protein
VRDHVAADGSKNDAVTFDSNDLAANQTIVAGPPPGPAPPRRGTVHDDRGCRTVPAGGVIPRRTPSRARITTL